MTDTEEEKKTTLYDLVKQQSAISQNLMENDGELTPEIEALIKQVSTDLPKKVDNYATFMDKLKSDISYLKELEKTISSKRRQLKIFIKILISGLSKLLSKSES